MDFGKIPSSATIKVTPFKAHVSEEKLQHFKDLLKLSPTGIATFENTNAPQRRYGVNRDWLVHAKEYWLNQFDWRKHEDYINSFPNFTTTIKDSNGSEVDVHFLALFSAKADAIPIAFFHGWPGSFAEFFDLVEILRKRHTPQDLPYHIIVPSLPGFAYSSGPPVEHDYGIENICEVMNTLMVGLGFGSGYLCQGGDIGSGVCRVLAMAYEGCKGIHLNMINMPRPENADELHVDEIEKRALPNGDEFFNSGMAYALEHGTRTATIGHALSSSPLATLSWVGEKFLEWSDEDPPLEKILEGVTLYWMTDTMSRNMYTYRGIAAGDERPRRATLNTGFLRGGRKAPFVDKPSGYSFFPHDLFPIPRSWAALTCNLVSYGQHESGGHFAAMEKPKELLADVEDWVKKAWKPRARLS